MKILMFASKVNRFWQPLYHWSSFVLFAYETA